MILGRVVGELWAARRHAGLDGRKLLIIQPHAWYEPAFPVANLVAVDGLGAGVGEDVVVCMGEPARRSLVPDLVETGPHERYGYSSAAAVPVDAAVMAIVDRVQVMPAAQVAGAFADDPTGSAQARFAAAALATPTWEPADPGPAPAANKSRTPR